MNLKDTRRAAEFSEILGIIHAGRMKAFEAVNVALIDTYWAIGEQLSRKVSDAGWGKGVVAELAGWLAMQSPDLKGVFGLKSLAYEAVLRDLRNSAKSRNAVARIVLVEASASALPMQVRGGEGVLSPNRDPVSVVASRT